MNGHPLDRSVWSALTTRRARLATGGGHARRLDPAVGLFAASGDASPASLTALADLPAPGEVVALIEPDDWPLPPGLNVVRQAPPVQMVTARRPAAAARDASPIVALGDTDAAEMLALATLTEPGPFFAATHRFGGFVGVRDGDALVAMAGTRLALDARDGGSGHVEVSGVCTHPDHRGRGHAAALIARVVAAIVDGGDCAFLTSYADNRGAIALYEALGFVIRRTMTLTVLERPALTAAARR